VAYRSRDFFVTPVRWSRSNPSSFPSGYSKRAVASAAGGSAETVEGCNRTLLVWEWMG
jgi:hypothetical protein